MSSNDGVLTGANDRFWPTLQLLVRACLDSKVPIAIADHGLRSERRRWLQTRGAVLMDGHQSWATPLESIAAKHSAAPMSACEAWLKPLVCSASPFERTIWIDSDAVPLRNVRELFDLFREGSWLTRDEWISQQHASSLYRVLVDSMCSGVPRHYSNICRINSGVFGFRQEDAWIREWIELCNTITRDERLLAKCKCRDQSALVALLALKPDLPLKIIDDPTLNYPANGHLIQNSKRRKYYNLSQDWFRELKDDHPNVSIVHWMGRPKPWEIECKPRDQASNGQSSARRTTSKKYGSKRSLVVGIRGAGTINKGAESMLLATRDALRSRIDAQLVVSESRPFSENVDVIVDISGFCYSNHAPWFSRMLAAALKVRAAHPKARWLFLPQTLGPFAGVENQARALFRGAIVFARDHESLEELKTLGGDFHLELAPDVTWE